MFFVQRTAKREAENNRFFLRYSKRHLLCAVWFFYFWPNLYISYYSAYGASGQDLGRSFFCAFFGSFLALSFLSFGKRAGAVLLTLYSFLLAGYGITILKYGLFSSGKIEILAEALSSPEKDCLPFLASYFYLFPVIGLFFALTIFFARKISFSCLPLGIFFLFLSFVPQFHVWLENKPIEVIPRPGGVFYRWYRLSPGFLGNSFSAIALSSVYGEPKAVPHKEALPAGIFKREGEPPYKQIIVVIGESALAERHGFEGYGVVTTPNMDHLAQEGRLCVVHKTHSSANVTHNAVPMLFSFFEPQKLGALYGEKNLIELAKDQHYQTIWLDAQRGSTVYSRSFGYLSEFSDKVVRPELPFGKERTTWRDESLLPFVEKAFAQKSEKGLYVFHLMGSHYPYGRGLVKEDYQALPHAEDYDRSIHRTDRILQKIITLADRSLKDYILFYLSDHGEIVDFSGVGHGIQNGGYKQYQIPFFIAGSAEAKIKPLCEMAEGNRNEEGYFTGLMFKYLLLDAMGYKAEGKEIERLKHQDLVLHSDDAVYLYKDLPTPVFQGKSVS